MIMSLIDVVLISIGLSMDSFAVSICKGLSLRKYKLKNSVIIGLYFAIFHGLMPLIGYFVGSSFESVISDYDHWIIFILLSIIGINMIRNASSKGKKNSDIDAKEMLPLAFATSIDAFAIGITFSLTEVNLFYSILIISTIIFLITNIGVYIGYKFKRKYEKKASIFGGIILICIGIKIILEHLNII
jgi:putative Mn2+ efflux pump MntP